LFDADAAHGTRNRSEVGHLIWRYCKPHALLTLDKAGTCRVQDFAARRRKTRRKEVLTLGQRRPIVAAKELLARGLPDKCESESHKHAV
jgi:hypothetical protein